MYTTNISSSPLIERKEIIIKCTGEQKVFHDYFKPFICTSNIELPKQYNQGYNSFRFIGGEPNFKGVDMPKILKRETNNYKFFECQIQIVRSDNSTVSGYYIVTENKATNEVNETFHFD